MIALDEPYVIDDTDLSFRDTPYYNNLAKGKDCPKKIAMRKVVTKLVLETCKWSKEKPLNFMSLPGPMWSMERNLFRETGGNTRFTAFEHNKFFMKAGARNVPGDLNRPDKHGLRKLVDLNTPYYRTSAAQWINSNFSDWCLTREDVPGGYLSDNLGYDPWQAWLDRYWSIDAYWLDFTSCLHPKLVRALKRLPTLVGKDSGEDKPVVISLLKGREKGETRAFMKTMGLAREDYIFYLLDRRPGYSLEVRRTFEYRNTANNTGSTMVNFIAVWKKQPNNK